TAASPDPALVWQATGRVVDEATNQPVANAEVRFTAGSTARFVLGSGETARSAADGSFTFAFERLSPGYLELEVRHSAHGTTHVPALEMIAKAEARGTRTAAIGDVLLARGAQLAGRVLAADGTTPVPGARIVYYRAAFGVPTRFFGEAVDVAMADAAGAFVVPQRLAPGYRRHWLAAITDTGVGWRELQLSRRAAEQDRFDLVLRPMASLRLLVTDDAGRPVAGALAVALPACEPLSSRYDAARQQPHLHPLPPFLRRTSGADGRVTLSVPVGDEAMQFGERVPAGRTVVRVVSAAHRQWGQTIDLAAGTEREIGVRLVGGTRAVVRGAVLTQDSAAIAGAEVRIAEQRATTDAVGQFRIDGVDVATGTVAVHRSSAAGARWRLP
ncbi:MAG: carboxypeptidase-like regulatory domain-containing protein, partial [Planctomycetota bacterium]